MKNRRLNLLFIAIMALAAAPQALQDARRLANAAQDRAETEFWSIFLSYQMPGAKSLEARGTTELVAMRRQGAPDSCPLTVIPSRAAEAARASQANKSSTPARAIRETRRASSTAELAASQPVDPVFDDETLASLDAVRRVGFSEEGKNRLRAAGPHARDTEKFADVATRAAFASFVPENENIQIRMKQALEMDKPLRRRIRYTRNRSDNADAADIPLPNPAGSM